ncbi:ATP-binding cassette domain-containing protein [[Haemophilus] ducreyi]|uniref:peptide ABC transporter ATP-binding protein n=1 Tax=Haemophilus ducreyi TaxID=730 RepID=UPI000654E69D|nr:ABC transporter ATP-binding protein [[Haemophilus] ducreyi]AKO45280.1 peptide ABC transporter ATP-binding protein [[Haemophilus] ducreyi]AKO46682.1 peptide ABC transporter ATP-binding protein [[Haemophilus] ducreyi]AKO48023.1 peptide ABC transporter ATP-binding protein [[Haemophilus] ducreyi]AKO49410.1 peptide ABC transporter ATP-binding protein [[Haemophilus] ducreyi]ANF61551.1 peptide ABC transporter ATP-binding protein [[Haemophilus] ducreyi]
MALLEVHNLNKRFTDHISLFHKQRFYAVKNISFNLNEGETIAIIGENGAGKSTLAKMIAGITKPTSGDMFFRYKKLTYGDYQFRTKHIRMMFQDPNHTFNPNHNIGQILDAPLRLATDMNEQERNECIFNTLKLVGMYPEYALIPIKETSTSQKQRIALARALILSPEIIIADDTLSTLDFSVKTQLTNLMLNLQEKLGIAFIYVGQHLGIIKHIADKLIIMHQGEAIEYGYTKEVLLNPQNPITARLIESHFGKMLTEDAWAK